MTRDLLARATDVAPPAAAAHEPSLFHRIFREEAPYVGRTLRYLGIREAHLEDVCQEVFVVVHRQLARYEGGPVRAWIRQICVYVANNHRRSLRRHPEDPMADPPEVADRAPQQGELEERQARQQLLTALDLVPKDQRAVFVLFEIEELTMPEVAQAVGCPLQTAYSRLYAARAKVQAAMKGTES